MGYFMEGVGRDQIEHLGGEAIEILLRAPHRERNGPDLTKHPKT
jgi:hypothetical protein